MCDDGDEFVFGFISLLEFNIQLFKVFGLSGKFFSLMVNLLVSFFQSLYRYRFFGWLGMLVFSGIKLVGAGVLLGLVASFGLRRLIASLLFGVSASDPLTFAGVAALLFGVALLNLALNARDAMPNGGKLVVAGNQEELPKLNDLHERGRKNGLEGLRLLGAEEMREIEPHVGGVAALRVPQEGIVDIPRINQSRSRSIMVY